MASSFSDAPPVNDTQQIGGPLYAHGWQMLLSQMGVVAEGGRGLCVYSGIGRVDFLPAVSCFELYPWNIHCKFSKVWELI